ncbi:DUF4249 domain-containing protein [Maribacter sp.]|nr:DUF4249 domain-containing protein [Maribacter sp.]
MKKRYLYLTIALLALLTSCLDEIAPDLELKEQVFISGLLTSDPDFVALEIQNTVSVVDTTFSAVNDAQVSLFTRDASGSVSLVSDSFTVNNGEYQTSEIIRPTVGNTYWVEVILQDQTVLKSEEEILKTPIPIISMVKNGSTVRVTVTDQIEEENFYLVRLEVLKDGTLISDNYGIFNDTVIEENLEEFVEIDNVNDGETVRASIYNINFNTFQFYDNVFRAQDDLGLSALFSPINLEGNVTNTTTNELALGNFGIAGFSTLTIDF